MKRLEMLQTACSGLSPWGLLDWPTWENFHLQGQLFVLTLHWVFQYPFHLCVTAVARERSRSFCQKCRWLVAWRSQLPFPSVCWNESFPGKLPDVFTTFSFKRLETFQTAEPVLSWATSRQMTERVRVPNCIVCLSRYLCLRAGVSAE